MVDFSRYRAEWVGLDEINAQDDVFQKMMPGMTCESKGYT